MTWFGLELASGLKEIISEQVSHWAFGVFFMCASKNYFVDADDFFLVCSRIISSRPYLSQCMHLQWVTNMQLEMKVFIIT